MEYASMQVSAEQGKDAAKQLPNRPAIGLTLMPLMNTPFQPGSCLKTIDAMSEGSKKQIALAEYYYFSAQPEKTVEETEPYLRSPDLGLRLSSCWLYGYANLSLHQIQKARLALDDVQKILAENAETAHHLRAAGAFVAMASAVLLHLPLPDDLPSAREFLPLLPPGLQAFALYVQAHYRYLKGEYGQSLGIVEAALDLGADRYPIPAIYLHLVAVMSYMSIKNTEAAQKHLLAAWALARPDNLIEGFGEHHGLLGGMLESVIKKGWPEEFKQIIAITYRFSWGWRQIHNPVTGHEVADNLTTTEFTTAMLAARGWTNQEIAEHMGISLNTVKQYISVVLQKLDIQQRKDLKKYMLR